MSQNKNVSYHKQIARRFVIDHVKFSSHQVWSPCRIRLLFLILCAHM